MLCICCMGCSEDNFRPKNCIRNSCIGGVVIVRKALAITGEKFMTKIQQMLFEKQDLVFKKFQVKLNPTVDEKTIIGVRVPQLRAMAKNIFSDAGQFNIEKFFNSVPHKYFEENFIHCLLIEQINDFEECSRRLDEFLPYIDNWAVCDTCRPKVFKKNPEKALVLAKKWIKSHETYTVRYGIGVFMCYFLNENFRAEYLKIVAAIKSDEYYINMAIAWYFSYYADNYKSMI